MNPPDVTPDLPPTAELVLVRTGPDGIVRMVFHDPDRPGAYYLAARAVAAREPAP